MDAESLKSLFPLPQSVAPQSDASAAAAMVSAREEAATGLTLIIEFGGFCVFLPAANGRAMYVFLPDTTPQNGVTIPRHKAVVQFVLADAAGSQVVPIEGEGLWTLNGRDLRIVLPQEPDTPDLTIAGFDYTPDKPPEDRLLVPPLTGTPNPPNHFGWVSSIEEACKRRGTPNGGVMDRVFLDPTLDNARAGLLGIRMALTTGTLSAVEFLSNDESFVLCRYRPFREQQPNPNDHRQFVASKVRSVIDVPADSVKLQSRDLSTGEDKEALELRPSFRNRQILVRILNEEAEAILGTSQTRDFEIATPREQDRIFETYAKLCPVSQALQQSGGLPIPVAAEFRPRIFANEQLHKSVPCSPARAS